MSCRWRCKQLITIEIFYEIASLSQADTMSNVEHEEDALPPNEVTDANPAVIDDEMLLEAVLDQGPQQYARIIIEEEGVDFAEIKHLRLDYRNILRVDNLWTFTSLVRLQLNNNLVEKIENLDALVNLKWLDLSFNWIRRIEGLDGLVKLTDLVLCNNYISVVEKMDTLADLQVFSIGNNSIADLSQVLYLRRFRKLDTLNLKGNPIYQNEDYGIYVTAMLKKLRYLDYILVDQNVRDRGLTKFDIAVQKLDEDDEARDYGEYLTANQLRDFDYHKDAFVENLNNGKQFDLLYENEIDILKLDLDASIAEERQNFKEAFSRHSQAVFDYGIAKHGERMEEIALFTQCADEAIMSSRAKSSDKVNEFLAFRTEWEAEVVSSRSEEHVRGQLLLFNQKLDLLKDDLIDLELLVVDQLEELIRDFSRNIGDMVSSFIEYMHSHWTACRDLENMNAAMMIELGLNLLEKFAHGNLNAEVEDQLGEDKELLMTQLQTSHDLHLLRLDQRQDSAVKHSNQWLNSMFDRLHESMEQARNRERIVEILHFVSCQSEDGEDIANDILADIENNSKLDAENYAAMIVVTSATDHRALSATEVEVKPSTSFKDEMQLQQRTNEVCDEEEEEEELDNTSDAVGKESMDQEKNDDEEEELDERGKEEDYDEEEEDNLMDEEEKDEAEEGAEVDENEDSVGDDEGEIAGDYDDNVEEDDVDDDELLKKVGDHDDDDPIESAT